MRGLAAAVFVVLAGGLMFFAIGQSLPRRWFDPDGWLYRCRRWENDGRIYEKLGVRRWKDVVPDMSRIIPGVFKKKAGVTADPEHMYRLVLETCVAELIHWLLIVAITIPVYAAIGGWGGAAGALAYILGNMVFIVIQRYNRPRLIVIYKRMEKRRERCS